MLAACNSSRHFSSQGEIIQLADPTIFVDNHTYYLYGTSEAAGFKVYVSNDLKDWKYKGLALKKGESYGTVGFWAPQIFKHHNKYYMAYTANENIAIAVANNPEGPFRQNVLAPLKSDVRIIDPFVFISDTAMYLYHVRLDKGNRIFVARLNADFEMMPSTLQECIAATTGWEDTQNVEWKVAEGPSVFKKNGYYYMLYSANDFRNPDYAVGYAVAESPYGPWMRHENNPIISRKDIQQNGPGHGEIFKNKKGVYNYVFHTHFSNAKVAPRKTAIIKLQVKKTGNKPMVFTPQIKTFQFLKEN